MLSMAASLITEGEGGGGQDVAEGRMGNGYRKWGEGGVGLGREMEGWIRGLVEGWREGGWVLGEKRVWALLQHSLG